MKVLSFFSAPATLEDCLSAQLGETSNDYLGVTDGQRRCLHSTNSIVLNTQVHKRIRCIRMLERRLWSLTEVKDYFLSRRMIRADEAGIAERVTIDRMFLQSSRTRAMPQFDSDVFVQAAIKEVADEQN